MATVSLLMSSAAPSPLASFAPPLSRAKRISTAAAPLAFLAANGGNRADSITSLGMATKFTGGRRRLGGGVVCYAATPLSPQTLQWVSAVSSAVLMLFRGTPIHKSFLVPLFALQAPATVISWIKGEYGTWAAFLALLVRLFYFIPGELELPFWTMLLVIVAPNQTMDLRGTQPGAIISLAIAGFLAFQHFSRVGSLRKAFDQGAIIPTIAIICTTAVACLSLF